MTKFPDDYQMTRQEIDDLRQDTKNALKSPEYCKRALNPIAIF